MLARQRWRLTVAAGNPVTVMSLLEAATGHIVILSADGGSWTRPPACNCL